MKRSDMVKEIKAVIRANSDLLEKQAEGEISYGKMAGLLAESILSHVEDKGLDYFYERIAKILDEEVKNEKQKR
jgi:hypothetical protein